MSLCLLSALFLYYRTRYTTVYTTKVIRKYMISNVIRLYTLCNVSLGGGGVLFLYDRTRYTIVYSTKVIQKYMISNVSFSEGGGHCFYTIVHAIRAFIQQRSHESTCYAMLVQGREDVFIRSFIQQTHWKYTLCNVYWWGEGDVYNLRLEILCNFVCSYIIISCRSGAPL